MNHSAIIFSLLLCLGILFLNSSCTPEGKGGGPTPTPSATANATVVPSPTPSPSATPTASITPSPTASASPTPSVTPAHVFDGANQTALGDFSFSVKPQQISPAWPHASEATQWRGLNLPAWLLIDPTDGTLSGIAPSTGTFEDLRLLYSKDQELHQIGPFTLEIKTDPLFSQQWSIKNSGQNSYSQSGGKANEDLRVLAAHQAGYSGKSFLIAVSDTGMDVNHEDLVDNATTGLHRDYINGSSSNNFAGTPGITSDPWAYHGTAVGGIIAAVGWNALGIRGVAPRANIASLNFIDSDQSLNKLIDQVTGPFDIVNQSWGVSNQFPLTIESDYLDALKTVTTQQRNGKGTIIIKAAGNGYQSCSGGSFCSENANQDHYNNNPYTLVVGALNAQGTKASYSNIGSSLWISAPGGEYGTTTPAILTADLPGCSVGGSQTRSATNAFDQGLLSENSQCNYTSSFNGTSAATPHVAGAIALILESNPQLTWRDLKHVLAVTARRVDPNSPTLGTTVGSEQVVFSRGWVTNAAGFAFHNHYGFGAVDTTAAISYARTHTPLPPSETALLGSASVNKPFGTSSSTVATQTITSSLSGKIVESIEITALVSHSYFGDVAIEVVSPAGTKSILMTPFNTYSGTNDFFGSPIQIQQTYNLISHAFYGENASGTWTVNFLDQMPEDEGKLLYLEIKALVH